jgi:hypothetical protein
VIAAEATEAQETVSEGFLLIYFVFIALHQLAVSDFMFRLQNHGADFDEIWCGHYATIGYPNISSFFFNFLQSVIPT